MAKIGQQRSKCQLIFWDLQSIIWKMDLNRLNIIDFTAIAIVQCSALIPTVPSLSSHSGQTFKPDFPAHLCGAACQILRYFSFYLQVKQLSSFSRLRFQKYDNANAFVVSFVFFPWSRLLIESHKTPNRNQHRHHNQSWRKRFVTNFW